MDAWGGEFQYFSPGTSGDRDYEIVSLGKDGQEGGRGADIKSWEAGSPRTTESDRRRPLAAWTVAPLLRDGAFLAVIPPGSAPVAP